jgi:hypothetical protein
MKRIMLFLFQLMSRRLALCHLAAVVKETARRPNLDDLASGALPFCRH